MPATSQALLRCILQTVARQTFPEERLRDLVLPKNAGKNQLQAYNMCDGSKSQGEIAKALGLDAGNFSRTVGRWVEAGIVFRMPESKLQHVYLLAEAAVGKDKGK